MGLEKALSGGRNMPEGIGQEPGHSSGIIRSHTEGGGRARCRRDRSVIPRAAEPCRSLAALGTAAYAGPVFPFRPRREPHCLSHLPWEE